MQLKLAKDISRCGTLSNLRTMEFDEWYWDCDKKLLDYFLKHSPNLEELILKPFCDKVIIQP